MASFDAAESSQREALSFPSRPHWSYTMSTCLKVSLLHHHSPSLLVTRWTSSQVPNFQNLQMSHEKELEQATAREFSNPWIPLHFFPPHPIISLCVAPSFPFNYAT